MVEFEACTAALNASCASLPKQQPILPLPHHNNSSVYQHSSQHISNKIGGGGGGTDEEERGGQFSFDDLRIGGGASARPPLKRARLEEDDELSISPIYLSGPHDSAPSFLHHHQPLYHHHHSGVEASNNFSGVPSQQMAMPEQNGHATQSAPIESHFGGDAHLLSESSSYHHSGLLYPPMPPQAAYLQGVNVAEVLAELERERRKNAELQGRVVSLEAQLVSDDRHGAFVHNGTKRNKKQRRVDKITGEGEGEDARKVPNEPISLPDIKEEEGVLLHVTLPLEDPTSMERQDTGVTWMSREEVTPEDLEKLNKDLVSERDDSGDSDDDDDEDDEDEDEFEEGEEGERRTKKKRKSEREQVWRGAGMGVEASRGGALDAREEAEKLLFLGPAGERDQDEDELEVGEKKSRRKKRKEGRKGKHGEKSSSKKRGYGQEVVSFRGSGMMSSYKKAPKTAFCPREVKRVMESGVLALKNAQSHTMRKIIVFASLGIRHGCEDLYELDFSHFSVVRRSEPYKSPKDPGEHVLYDQPGVRTKIFYPNRQNTILCPVRILDEEKAMRPVGPSCPSCLFLCIKYGGRTRNLPQNEYVRQRMGRNKLKSFGPLMCQMALLVHIRTGSFFFKALGITLLFMAGFPDDLVRKETKYRNLDLLQKYYRSDEDSKGEQLFHPYPTFFTAAMMVPPPLTHKAATASKVVGKKGPPPLLSKPSSTPSVPRYLQPSSARPPSPIPFPGLPPGFSPPPPSMPPVPTPGTAPGNLSPPGPLPLPMPPFGMYPPYPPMQGPPTGFPPMPWGGVNSYPPGPFAPPAFAYQPFPHSSHFIPPFYGPPYRFPPYGQQPSIKENSRKGGEGSGESDSDSDSRSSGAAKKLEEGDNTVGQ